MELNMELNWTPQFNKVVKKIKDKGQKLQQATLPAHIKIRIMEEAIATLVDYSLHLSPFTKTQLEKLDTAIAGVRRMALKLPRYFPTYALIDEAKNGGWGKGSLQHKATTYAISTLCAHLNDTGTLGLITKTLLNRQRALMNQHPDPQMAMKYMMTLRQADILATSPITLTNNGEELQTKWQPNQLL